MTVHVSHKEVQFAHPIALTERNEQRIRMQKYMYRHGSTDISISNIDIYTALQLSNTVTLDNYMVTFPTTVN